ncbi:MAG: uridine diphosphate-N-acetylglucosamine-binding protein YvcK [Elainellaceae cyanobacterium]
MPLKFPKPLPRPNGKRYRRLRLGRASVQSHRWFKWLAPGLFIKRWLFTSAVGVFLTALGVAIWAKRTPVFYITQFIDQALSAITDLIPNYVSGPVAVLVGILLVFLGQSRTLNSITEVLIPDGDEDLVDLLSTHRRLNRGPKVVVVGGGTGLSTLLRGLKHFSANITAVVTVADDGGSSGRLRREIGVLPPGDIRNCLAALADEEKLLTELFQYRFQAGDGLEGHSFGNLFITAMGEVTGDLEQAIAASSRVLAVRGQVLPATLSDVRLWAEMADGRRIEGESNIAKARGKVVKVGCSPADPPAVPKVLQAIREADYVVIGPGSLYTSIIPNLLVPEITHAIAACRAPRVYVCNIMTEPGETDDYTVADHIRAIDTACGGPLFDAVLVQGRSPSENVLAHYSSVGAAPVFLDREAVRRLERRIIIANVMAERPDGQVRHSSEQLAGVLMRWYSRHKGSEGRKGNEAHRNK